MSILIDTNVLVEYLRGNGHVVERFVEEYGGGGRICFSPVGKAEIFAGLRKGEERIAARLFGLMECLAIDEETGRKAGEYLRTFHASHNVEIADALVAATAHRYEARLWTLNRKHYPMKDIEYVEFKR